MFLIFHITRRMEMVQKRAIFLSSNVIFSGISMYNPADPFL